MRLYYLVMRLFCQLAFVLYFRGRVFGRSNVPQVDGVVLACNHQSYFDPASAGLALPREVNFIARDTLFLNPFFGRLISSVNAFPVKRGVADISAVKEMLRRLKAGKLVLVFPEATRSHDGAIGRINPNSLAVAKKAGVPIVPAVVDGAFEAWPRDRLLPRPRSMHVTYAEPLSVDQVEQWSVEELAETVAERMAVALRDSAARRRRCERGGLGRC